ncbi:hypothetical protein [[Clostridium] fimetarium]|uniref:Uncharacterized protein n=1 Tax=[Clostridium] fimetarium TaxID=99656 RepID=A0A1I0NCN5_9FIRM|nr:hypothetical protein [[Clostridium] fimetarium]SEV99137.1 hypothetical protein SAMN05421659_10310 [[Clostridium] fimetarium]
MEEEDLDERGEYAASLACNLMSITGAIPYKKWREIDSSHPYFTKKRKDKDDNPNLYIANMSNGAAASFKYFQIENVMEIHVKVRGYGIGEIQVSTADGSGLVARVIILPSREWKVFKEDLKIEKEVKVLYFTYIGIGVIDFYSFTLIQIFY